MVTFMMLYFVILKLNDIIKLKKWPKIFKKKKIIVFHGEKKTVIQG